MANTGKVKTNILETVRRDSIQLLRSTLGNTKNRLRQDLLAILHHLIQALENSDENPPHNP